MRSSLTTRSAAGAMILGLLALAPGATHAQDFLFDRPDVTVSVFGGWVVPEEGGDILDFTRDHLTVEEGDFESPAGMAEVAWRVNERLDLGVGFEYASRTVASESRRYLTMDDEPIRQRTRFSRARFSATARGYLLPRGREVSAFAWVPNRWSPYVGGGVGASTFEFVQVGDFVDEATLDIFRDELATRGTGLSAHALGGIQLSITPRILLRGEYQYVWGQASPGGDEWGDNDFHGFGEMDLSGWRGLLGLTVRL